MPFKKAAEHEREKAAQQQEDHDEHVGDRRRKVAGDFPLCNRPDMPPGFLQLEAAALGARGAGCPFGHTDLPLPFGLRYGLYLAHAAFSTVSGRVIVRNTSSSLPSSLCIS